MVTIASRQDLVNLYVEHYSRAWNSWEVF